MPKTTQRKSASIDVLEQKHRQAAITRPKCNGRSQPRRGDRLCARCRSLDFNLLFQTQTNKKRSAKPWEATIYQLGVVQKNMLGSQCPLCRLFATLFPEQHNVTQRVCVLKAFSTLQHHFRYTHRKKQMQDTTILSVAPVGTVTWKPNLERKLGVIYLANEHGKSHHQSILGNKIDSRRVNYGLAKDWIRHCRADHKGYCSYQPSIATHSILGFKTIDCETRQVIKHTKRVEYVALSYVWGGGSHASTRSLPNPAFRVIEDAITVTKELGFRYLWIDRYCISQIDASERRHQIARMDQIYADAVLTIVAAAGEGPDYGLPGVSETFRRA